MTKKQIPNILTSLRIVLCAPLLFTTPLSPWFFALYVSCGLSDVLDGFIARRLGVAGKLGAALDSAADVIFVSVTLVKLVPIVALPRGILLWIACIALVRLISLAAGYRKYHALAFLHTYANKAAGVLLFCFPLLFNAIGVTASACVICAVASLSAAEELMINIVSRELDRDVRAVCFVNRR